MLGVDRRGRRNIAFSGLIFQPAHTVASVLKAEKKPLIITLSWVLESVVAGEQLPMQNYLLQEFKSVGDVYCQRLSEQAQLLDIARIPADHKSGLQSMRY